MMRALSLLSIVLLACERPPEPYQDTPEIKEYRDALVEFCTTEARFSPSLESVRKDKPGYVFNDPTRVILGPFMIDRTDNTFQLMRGVTSRWRFVRKDSKLHVEPVLPRRR